MLWVDVGQSLGDLGRFRSDLRHAWPDLDIGRIQQIRGGGAMTFFGATGNRGAGVGIRLLAGRPAICQELDFLVSYASGSSDVASLDDDEPSGEEDLEFMAYFRFLDNELETSSARTKAFVMSSEKWGAMDDDAKVGFGYGGGAASGGSLYTVAMAPGAGQA